MQDTCDDYFRSMNLIAKLISLDIDETKEAYQDLWETLTAEEKCQALDDAIIHPDAILKYSIFEDEVKIKEPNKKLIFAIEYSHFFEQNRCQLCTRTMGNAMFKDVTDSGFYHHHSWFSKSQQNLSCVVNTEYTKPLGILKSPYRKKEIVKPSPISFEVSDLELKQQKSRLIGESISILSKIKNKVYAKSLAADDERELLCESKSQVSVVPKSSVLKPKNPPPPPPTAKTCYDEESSLFSSFEKLNTTVSSSEIPKTGFDFLDNW